MSAHKFVRRLRVAVLCVAVFQAQAQLPSSASSASSAPSAVNVPVAAVSAAASSAMAEGEVRKVDTEAGKLTLRHGRIENLDMPGMTMVFRVVDAKMLEGLKVGDKLRFSADRIQGALTVTAIERAR